MQKQRQAQLSSALDRILETITLVFQTLYAQKQFEGKNESLLYISIGYGGESVSQSPLKDKPFSTFLDRNPPFELTEKADFAFDKSLSRPMARHRQQCHQATSERQIAIAPLSLIAIQSRNLMVAHPGSCQALQFPSAVDVVKDP